MEPGRDGLDSVMRRALVSLVMLMLASSCTSTTSTLDEPDAPPEGGSLADLDRTPRFDPAADAPPFDLSGGARSSGAEISDHPEGIESLPEDVQQVVALFATDWTRQAGDLSTLVVGLTAEDPRDIIAPIDSPLFETVTQAGYWLAPDEPGAMVTVDGESRFYPLTILTRHEVVNDRFGTLPVAVTYCPLCNTAATFDRRVDGAVLRFGVSGLLRNSDLVMWDKETESLWQQITGQAIVGSLAGSSLVPLPTAIVSFGQYAADVPDGRSLSPRTGYAIKYGANPYRSYSSRSEPMARFFEGELDPRLEPMERVVGVQARSEGETQEGQTQATAIAIPFSVLETLRVVNTTVGEEPIVVWWGGGTVDPLDATSVAGGRSIGTGIAWSSVVDGQPLEFEALVGDDFTDRETGSTWSILGRATAGPLEGTQLDPVIHRNEFWFAWAAFFPTADLYVDG